ncbi:Uncharacterised protein [Moraxella caviae]|nr:Uncharacterised protein [Moraxella caviae]
MMTCFAPAMRCKFAALYERKCPVHSSTTSMRKSCHGKSLGFFWFKSKISMVLASFVNVSTAPLTSLRTLACTPVADNLPCVLSNFSKCSKVSASHTSLMATICTRSHSVSSRCKYARKTLRPMRPKPLIAKRIGEFCCVISLPFLCRLLCGCCGFGGCIYAQFSFNALIQRFN